jgi:HSP20 family protein
MTEERQNGEKCHSTGVIFLNVDRYKAEVPLLTDQNPSIMIRPSVRNRTFDRMGERYAPLIDPYHFLGFTPFEKPSIKYVSPPAVLKRSGKLYELELAVPGFTKEEIRITVADAILRIKGEKRMKEDSKVDEYLLEEFDYCLFEREFRLVDSIAREDIKESLEKGILRLTFVDVPEEEEKRYREIEVL